MKNYYSYKNVIDVLIVTKRLTSNCIWVR